MDINKDCIGFRISGIHMHIVTARRHISIEALVRIQTTDTSKYSGVICLQAKTWTLVLVMTSPAPWLKITAQDIHISMAIGGRLDTPEKGGARRVRQ